MIKKEASIASPQALTSFPRVFFDGVEQLGLCGCGVYIIVNESSQFFIHWNGERGSNNKVEAMALAGLLFFCSFLNILSVSIFGDSKVIVDFVEKKINIFKPHLVGWLDRIKSFWDGMEGSSIHHINGAQNQQADSLSKKGLLLAPGFWFMQLSYEEKILTIQEFSLPVF